MRWISAAASRISWLRSLSAASRSPGRAIEPGSSRNPRRSRMVARCKSRCSSRNWSTSSKGTDLRSRLTAYRSNWTNLPWKGIPCSRASRRDPQWPVDDSSPGGDTNLFRLPRCARVGSQRLDSQRPGSSFAPADGGGSKRRLCSVAQHSARFPGPSRPSRPPQAARIRPSTTSKRRSHIRQRFRTRSGSIRSNRSGA